MILQNGLLPAREAILSATAEGAKYGFLRQIVDPSTNVLFKYLDEPDESRRYLMLSEFEADTSAQAMTNLYLSSQITQHKMMAEYLSSDEFAARKDDTFAALGEFSAGEKKRKQRQYLDEQNKIMSR